MGIYTSSLLEQKKFNAISDLEKCLDGKFIWPQPLSQYKGADKYVQEGKLNIQLNLIIFVFQEKLRIEFNVEALNTTWTVIDEWEDLHFGGPNRTEDFYRNLLEAVVCLMKSLVLNVS